MIYPTPIRNLIKCYRKLPGIGEKTAERLALATLNLDQETVQIFSSTIESIHSSIRRCKKCNNLSEDDFCDICKDASRDMSIICVVEEAKNVILFEKIGTYNGMYHVLDGLISPLNGITPDQIHISSLIERIKEGKIKEVIVAVKPSIEGETTSLYILKMLENLNVKVSKIAHGVPLGADIDYMDSLTLEMALEDRKIISDKDS